MKKYHAIHNFCRFQMDANKATFVDIFGQRLGSHLWFKFTVDYDYNLIRLTLSLDYTNAEKLISYADASDGLPY